MNKYLIALLIFCFAAILAFITIVLLVEEPQYLSEEQVMSELNITEKED